MITFVIPKSENKRLLWGNDSDSEKTNMLKRKRFFSDLISFQYGLRFLVITAPVLVNLTTSQTNETYVTIWHTHRFVSWLEKALTCYFKKRLSYLLMKSVLSANFCHSTYRKITRTNTSRYSPKNAPSLWSLDLSMR